MTDAPNSCLSIRRPQRERQPGYVANTASCDSARIRKWRVQVVVAMITGLQAFRPSIYYAVEY